MRAKDVRQETVRIIADSDPIAAENFQQLLATTPVSRTCKDEIDNLSQVISSRLASHPVSTLEELNTLTKNHGNTKRWLDTLRTDVIPVTTKLGVLSY